MQEGDAYWGLRGAMTGLGKVDTVKMYPILIRYVFVGICSHIRGVRTNRNQSIPLGVREKFTVPIGRVLIGWQMSPYVAIGRGKNRVTAFSGNEISS